MDDPGLIFFEEVRSTTQLPASYSSCTDEVCVEHYLYHRSWAHQSLDTNHVQEHLRRPQVSNHSLHRSRICYWLDRQLQLLTSLYVLPNHGVY